MLASARFRSVQQVLPELQRRGIAALGMRSLGGDGQPLLHGVVGPEEALRYAMSLPVATTISGIDSLAVLRQNVAVARGFVPIPAVGRAQRGYPPAAELPLRIECRTVGTPSAGCDGRHETCDEVGGESARRRSIMEEGHFETLENAVRRHIVDALTLARGNQRQAAALLGVTRWKLARMITRFDLRDFVNGIRGVDQHTAETSFAEDPAPEASISDQHAR